MGPAAIETRCTTVFPTFQLGREDALVGGALVFATIDTPNQIECRFVSFGSDELWMLRVSRP